MSAAMTPQDIALVQDLRAKLANANQRVRDLEKCVESQAGILVKTNEDGTFDLIGTAEAADWCREHGMGIIIGVGYCDDPEWQHVHHMDHAHALAGKKAIIFRSSLYSKEKSEGQQNVVAGGSAQASAEGPSQEPAPAPVLD